MAKITIQDIATKLTEQNGLSKKEAVNFANKMFDLIRDALEKDNSVKVKGLGTFKIIDVDSRESVNVNTGERVLIKGHNKITFTPDILMKELVNKPFSQFETIVLNDGVDFNEKSEKKEPEETPENMPLVDFVSDEPKDEDIPEWVIEPYETHANPKPIDLGATVKPETVADATAKQESHAKQESSVKPEPATEAPSVQEPVLEPVAVVVDTPKEPEPSAVFDSPVDTKNQREDEYEDEEYDDYDDERPKSKSWLLWLLTCVLALAAGYLLGSYFPFQSLIGSKEKTVPQIEEMAPVEPVVESQPVEPVVADSVLNDMEEADGEKAPETEKSDVKALPDTPEKPVTQKLPDTPKQPEAKKQPEVKKQPEAPKQAEPKKPAEAKPAAGVKLDKYEAMDSRVRTGAYRIVGTDHLETVREGDNIQRITKRTLGQGMECYIEVYNNLKASSQLKAGQKIKIPKVEWKRKKKAQK